MAILGVNSSYLATITFLEWLRGETYQNYFYQAMFLVHLVLGLLLIVPFVAFGLIHMVRARTRRNRRAIRIGYALFAVSILVLLTGVLLMRSGTLRAQAARQRGPHHLLAALRLPVRGWLAVLAASAGRAADPLADRVGLRRRGGGHGAGNGRRCTSRIRGAGTWPVRPRGSSISVPRWPGRRPAISSRPRR